MISLKLGAKKVGLGAQRVTKVDFEKLEKNVEEEDKAKQRLSIASHDSDGIKGAADKTRWSTFIREIVIVPLYTKVPSPVNSSILFLET